MSVAATRRWIQLHASGLVGGLLILAMSISLAWQTAEWLRLLRAPASLDSPHASNLPAPTSGQRLDLLFGASNLDSTAAPPATNLRLTLLGSFVHTDPTRSSAIIRQEGSEAQRYRVASEVASGVRLHAVYADRVELVRNGRRESLAFPRATASDDGASFPPSEAPTDAVDQLDELEAGNLEQLRERMDVLRQQMEASGTLPPEPDAEPTDQPTEGD